MPGFTHLQKAQPVTLAHHVGAYFEMFRRDRSRMADIRKRMNTCPLGAGALAGTTYPYDRFYTAELLGFDEPTRNSMDSVSDRDYVIELLSAMSTVADASEPFLAAKSFSGTPMNIVLFEIDDTLQYRKQYYATEKESGYCRACKRKDRSCVWRADLHSYYNEGYSACIQQRYGKTKELTFRCHRYCKGMYRTVYRNGFYGIP